MAICFFEKYQVAYFASTAGGLRNCNGAAFSSLKKYAAHFFNPDFIGTEEKEAPYAVTGRECGWNSK